jgi:hypothetical protein
MTAHLRQLEAVVRAATVTTAARPAWFGRLGDALPSRVTEQLGPAGVRAFAAHQLQQLLYEHAYTRGEPLPAPFTPAGWRRADDRFVARLADANTGAGQWQEGWNVMHAAATALVVRRDGLTLRAPRAACRGDAGTVAVCWPKHLPALSPGFYTFLGDLDLEPGARVVRLYWHLHPGLAEAFVRATTTALNRARVPFRGKVLDHPAYYDRCDAGVVYVGAHGLAETVDALGATWAAVGAELRPQVPAFTKRLGPGVGFADDPADGQSFGMSRCKLIAEGIAAAPGAGFVERLASVHARLRAAGVDPERPYLEPGSDDRDVAFP